MKSNPEQLYVSSPYVSCELLVHTMYVNPKYVSRHAMTEVKHFRRTRSTVLHFGRCMIYIIFRKFYYTTQIPYSMETV